jgi:hypothetical protein
VPEARVRLGLFRQALRRAHLLADRIGHILVARLVHLDAALEQRQALLATAHAEGGERGLRRGDGAVDVRFGPEGDARAHLLRRRVDHVKGLGLGGINPLAVDIELQVFAHAGASLSVFVQRPAGGLGSASTGHLGAHRPPGGIQHNIDPQERHR